MSEEYYTEEEKQEIIQDFLMDLVAFDDALATQVLYYNMGEVVLNITEYY